MKVCGTEKKELADQTHLTGTIHNGKMHINEKDTFEQFKDRSEPFNVSIHIQPVELYRSELSIGLFNALNDIYAKVQGIDKPYSRNMFKARHEMAFDVLEEGVDGLPKRPGSFFEFHHDLHLYFIVSTNDYSQAEMNSLIEGTINDCVDAGLSEEIQHLIKEWHQPGNE